MPNNAGSLRFRPSPCTRPQQTPKCHTNCTTKPGVPSFHLQAPLCWWCPRKALPITPFTWNQSPLEPDVCCDFVFWRVQGALNDLCAMYPFLRESSRKIKAGHRKWLPSSRYLEQRPTHLQARHFSYEQEPCVSLFLQSRTLQGWGLEVPSEMCLISINSLKRGNTNTPLSSASTRHKPGYIWEEDLSSKG